MSGTILSALSIQRTYSFLMCTYMLLLPVLADVSDDLCSTTQVNHETCALRDKYVHVCIRDKRAIRRKHTGPSHYIKTNGMSYNTIDKPKH